MRKRVTEVIALFIAAVVEWADDQTYVVEDMALLKSVKQNTRWSAVYDLENFSVDICFNGDYENIFTFSGK